MDEIKQKLAVIDAQIHRRSLQAQAVDAAPLLFPAAGLMIGIVAQEAISSRWQNQFPSVFLWPWGVALGALVLAVAIGRAYIRSEWRPCLLACGALCCFACLGAIRLLSFDTPAPDDIGHFVGDEQVLATVRGWVMTRPYQERSNWCFGKFAFADSSSRFYMSVDGVKAARGWTPATGTVYVHVDEPTPNVTAGDYIRVYCWLHRFSPPSNPGQFDMAKYLGRMNIRVGTSVPSRDAIEIDRSARRDWPARVRGWMSQIAAQALLGDARIDDPDEGLVQALLLGSRQDIDPDTYEAFRRTGLLHLVSLSGMNFAMLIAMLWWLCRIVGLSKNGRAFVGLVATAVFLMVVPPHAPTVRAAIVVWAYCASILAGRRLRALNSLCLAATVLLLLRPTQLFEAGWQLSFGCMAGILALTQRIGGFTRSVLPTWIRRQGRPGGFLATSLAFGMDNLILLLSTGLAAWIGGAGFLLYHFHTITPLTSLWTALTFPLVWAIMTVGFIQIILAFCLPTVAALLGVVGRLLAGGFIGVVRLFAMPNINLLLVGHVGLWVIVLYYALVLFWLFGRVRRPRLKQWICVAAALVLAGHLGVSKWQRTHHDSLRMTCLDVGHGQAIFVQLPGTKNVLFDAGSLYKSDIGTRIVLPFLDYVGIGRLDAIVISHGDIDHINGIPEIASRRPVGHVYASEAFFAVAQNEPAARLLTNYLHDRGYDIELVPQRIDGGQATIQTLWPTPMQPGEPPRSDNDQSIVSLIQFGKTHVLLCSDIESFAQRQLMALYPQLTADVIVVPHHGSMSTLDERFLEHFSPRTLVCSCGNRNGRTDPDPAQGGAAWFRTSIHGATTICIDGMNRVEIHSFVNDRKGE